MGILAQGLVGGGWITKGPRGKISVYQLLLKSLPASTSWAVFAGGGIERHCLQWLSLGSWLCRHLKVMLEMWVCGGYHHYKNSSKESHSATFSQLLIFVCVCIWSVLTPLPMLITPDLSSTFLFLALKTLFNKLLWKTASTTFSRLFTEAPEPSPTANWVFLSTINVFFLPPLY